MLPVETKKRNARIQSMLWSLALESTAQTRETTSSLPSLLRFGAAIT
jgi:hypothetical protein